MRQHYDLLAGLRKGDPSAQRTLYDVYKAKLMGLSRRYARNREEAQDVLQEAFIKIFSKIGRLEQPEKLEGWMMSVVVRTAIDHYRKGKQHEAIFDKMDLSLIEHNGTTIELSDFSDGNLIALVDALPQGCKITFNLFVVEGYSHAEIAEMLGISEGTSRSQLHYAKNLLREKINEQNRIHYYEKSS